MHIPSIEFQGTAEFCNADKIKAVSGFDNRIDLQSGLDPVRTCTCHDQ